MMQSGMDLWLAAGFFATSMQTLIRVYAHHNPSYMREAANTIGRRRPQNVRVTS
jgi:predicted transcriptional regulator